VFDEVMGAYRRARFARSGTRRTDSSRWIRKNDWFDLVGSYLRKS
jgi:hypothetical protein